MNYFPSNLILLGSIVYFLTDPPKASAAISISLSGSAANSIASLEKHQSHSLSANVGLSLGSYFQIGITHRRSLENKIGLKRQNSSSENAYEYLPFKDNTLSVTNSIDLTVIPYKGLISPMIFGGIARRDYQNQLDFLDNRSTYSQSLFPIPNYGFGAMIQLGMGMELKITQTYSPGIQTTIEDNKEINRSVKDSYTQVWIGYRL